MNQNVDGHEKDVKTSFRQYWDPKRTAGVGAAVGAVSLIVRGPGAVESVAIFAILVIVLKLLDSG